MKPSRSHWYAAAVSCWALVASAAPVSAQYRGPSVMPPEPLAMGYTGPYWGFGPIAGYGTLPPRAVYGPSVSPTEFPYYYGSYPGYAAVSPYPRSVSSYSSGPSVYPRVGRVGR